MKVYADLQSMPEDDRIETIGKAAQGLNVVAFCVDREGVDGMEKADRYVTKLLAKFPNLVEIDRFYGPTPGVITVKVRKK